MDIRNKRLSDDEFYGIRKEILEQWPTGKDVDFDEAVEYHKNMPESKSFSRKLSAAKKERRTLIQPRAGVALIDEHIKLLQYLQNQGEADLLPTTIDSYTRQNRYEEAEVGIKESIHTQKSMLNGFRPSTTVYTDAVRLLKIWILRYRYAMVLRTPDC